MSSKKIKCSGPCSMCVNCNQEDLSPCGNQGKSDNYTVATPDDLCFRLDAYVINKDERIDIIKYLQEHYDIAYRPSLVYCNTLALFQPQAILPNILHEVKYKGNTKYLIHNNLKIADTSSIPSLELYYEEIVNPTVIHTLMQDWKVHLIQFQNQHEAELLVSDRINNTFDRVLDLVDTVLEAYIDVMSDMLFNDNEEDDTDLDKE